jgi:hypothetical protein
MQPFNLETEFHSNRDKIIINIDEISKIVNTLKFEVCSNNVFELNVPNFDNYRVVLTKIFEDTY